MKLAMCRVTPVIVAIAASLWAGATSLAQIPKKLDSSARARIEQARASIIVVTVEDEAAQPVSQAVGFFIRNDLVATDIQNLNKSSRVRVAATKDSVLKVLSAGNTLSTICSRIFITVKTKVPQQLLTELNH